MKSVAPLLAAIGCIACFQVRAECTYPSTPAAVPNGKTASEAEMIEGSKSLKAYDKAVNEYLACLDSEKQARIEAMGPKAPPERVQQINSIYSKKYDAAVQEVEQRAANFNEQVRTYKNRDKT